MLAAIGEDAQRLALQPALHAVADLFGLGRLRQAHVQHEARHAGQRLRVGVEHGAGDAWVEHDDHRLAQERQAGAVAPFDARGFDAARAATLLLQLAHDPAGLGLHRGVDVLQRDPARRVHLQTFGADDEADAAAARAPQRIADAVFAELDLALGLRMPEVQRRRLARARRRHGVEFRRWWERRARVGRRARAAPWIAASAGNGVDGASFDGGASKSVSCEEASSAGPGRGMDANSIRPSGCGTFSVQPERRLATMTPFARRPVRA